MKFSTFTYIDLTSVVNAGYEFTYCEKFDENWKYELKNYLYFLNQKLLLLFRLSSLLRIHLIYPIFFISSGHSFELERNLFDLLWWNT